MYDRWIIGSRFSSGPYVVTTRPAATDAERRDALPPSLAAGVLERWAGGERQLLCEMHRSCSGGYEDFSSLTSRELVQALVWRIRAGELLVVPPVRPAAGAPLLRPEPDEPPAALPKAPPRSYQLRVRLMIDPRDARSRDDRFTLIGGALSSRAYSQTKTCRDDQIPGDAYTDLLFTGLVPDVPYWLEIDPGKEGPKHFAFESMDWSRLEPVARA